MNTINYRGFDFEFELDYQPAERQTLYYPGCAESFEIYNITLNGIDASDLLHRNIDDFEEEVINQIAKNREL